MINTDNLKTRYIANGHKDVTFFVMNKFPLPKGLDSNLTEIKVVEIK